MLTQICSNLKDFLQQERKIRLDQNPTLRLDLDVVVPKYASYKGVEVEDANVLFPLFYCFA